MSPIGMWPAGNDRKRDFPDFRQLDLNEMFPEYEDDGTT
jgi:hypothetical protein